MNRVGLKDYLLNYADDIDLLDCAKAWDAANEYGQFDIYGSVEEAAELNDWNVAQTLNESRHVDQDADSSASMAMGISRASARQAFSRMPATTSTISSIGLIPPVAMSLRASARISS